MWPANGNQTETGTPPRPQIRQIFSQTEHKICQSLTKLRSSQVIGNENFRKPKSRERSRGDTIASGFLNKYVEIWIFSWAQRGQIKRESLITDASVRLG